MYRISSYKRLARNAGAFTTSWSRQLKQRGLSDEKVLEKHSVLAGHYVDNFVWTPIIEGILSFESKDGNNMTSTMKYTVAAKENDQIVGHVSRCISLVS